MVKRGLSLTLSLSLAILLTASLAMGRGRQIERGADELANAFVEAYNAHDVEKLIALYADDISITTPDVTVLKGKEPHQRYYAAWFQSVPDVRAQIRMLVIEGDVFVLELLETGTYTKTLPTRGAPPARKQKLRYPFVIIGRVKSGKIVSMRFYENDLIIERQLRIRK
jgi:steroid delta-isomerase-like uncharacterized protein